MICLVEAVSSPRSVNDKLDLPSSLSPSAINFLASVRFWLTADLTSASEAKSSPVLGLLAKPVETRPLGLPEPSAKTLLVNCLRLIVMEIAFRILALRNTFSFFILY